MVNNSKTRAVPSDSTIEVKPSEPRAYLAFKDLVDWLEAPEEDVASSVGVELYVIRSWVYEKREPRAQTARKIYQIHASLSAVLQKLGRVKMKQFLFETTPSPRLAILSGDATALSKLAYPIIFIEANKNHTFTWRAETELDQQVDKICHLNK